MRRYGSLVIGLMLVLGGTAHAQSRPCEERVAEFRVYADLLAASRTKTEIEAAQGIAALRRENDVLRAEIERLRHLPAGQK